MGFVFDERDWSIALFLLSPKTSCGERIDERVMNEGSVSEDGNTGWFERIFERAFYQRAFNRIQTDNRSNKKSTLSRNLDLVGLTLSAPTALTNSVEPLCLATA